MNYLILNNNESFKNIDTKMNEVSLDGRDRVDVVFATITEEILEELSNNNGNGDSVLREQWLCRDSGTVIVVLEIPQNILYSGTGESISKCFGILNKESFYIELGSIKLEDQEKYRYFLIARNKNMNFDLFFNEEFVEKKEPEINQFIFEKIESGL